MNDIGEQIVLYSTWYVLATPYQAGLEGRGACRQALSFPHFFHSSRGRLDSKGPIWRRKNREYTAVCIVRQIFLLPPGRSYYYTTECTTPRGRSAGTSEK